MLTGVGDHSRIERNEKGKKEDGEEKWETRERNRQRERERERGVTGRDR